MGKSLHLIHLGQKARRQGKPARAKELMTLAQARNKIRLPYKPEHITEEELREAVSKLPK